MIRARFVTLGLLALLAGACGGGDSTKATRVSYPTGFPLSGSIPVSVEPVAWYEVAGLTAGAAYTAALSAQDVVGSEQASIEVDATFPARGPGDVLCMASVKTSQATCRFTAPAATVYLMVMNSTQHAMGYAVSMTAN